VLKLKKLQILGFKSFCDRTELKFHGEGIAAIIGPNGCGKSNIADAISWVLGEQSAKTLRGSRMEDVIFAGTRDRNPTGMAEVSLTLIDPEVYDGPPVGSEIELDVHDEMPEEDWDEATARARAAQETDRVCEELQPGKEEEAENGEASAAPSSEASVPEQGAPVVLKIRRRKFNSQQSRPGEIVVTRRLFRSGDSEYLLNGKLCRLRDIQELFMGTGLGPESYALIEQGRIGQILSSRPTDRRAIIEEAAGITKFKTKKRLAEARLEEAKQNLARVNDIFEEVTRQMNSLKRQAAKAERYVRLRDEMRGKLRVVLASKFAQLERESRELQAQLEALVAEMQAQTESVQLMEAEQSQLTHRGYEIETEARGNRERLSAIAMEIDRAQARQRHNEERCAELVARAASSQEELSQANYRLGSLEAEFDSNRQVLESASAELGAAQQDLGACQDAANSVATDLVVLEHQQDQCRTAILEAVAAAADLRNQISQAEERESAVDRENSKLNLELASATTQIETFGGQRGQLALEFESVSQRLTALQEEIGQVRHLLDHKKQIESESKTRLDTLRGEYASALGKKGSLEAVIAEHGYSTESVRRLFQSGSLQGGLAPAGVLADFLEVEPRFERVVEDFLRDELNYIVVKSWDAADEGLRLLRSDVDGRATFLVHPDDAQARFSFAVAEERQNPPHEAILPLKNCIRVLDGFGKSLEVILPKLRDGYIVPDPTFAKSLALENPDAFFLSESGECFRNVTVTGGKQRSEGPLSMKRDLREVLRLVGELEEALRREEAAVLTIGREMKELSSLLNRLEIEQREAEKQAMTSGHLLQQLDGELARTGERVGIYRQELGRLAAERSELQKIAAQKRLELSAEEEQRAALEQRVSAFHEQLAGQRQQRDLAAQQVSQHMAKVATLEERHRAATSVLERIGSLVSEMKARRDGLQAQFQASNSEKAEREAENMHLADQVVVLHMERTTCEEREQALISESSQVRVRLGEIEESLRATRQRLDQARDHRGELSAAQAKIQSDTGHMAETCLNELGVSRQDLIGDATLTLLEGEMLVQEDEAYHQMRGRLDAMGPVNMMALEEYKETAERHQFLDTQRKDLLDSIENTQATIREIDTVSRQKFEEAFNHINENFQATFRKLFGGGSAFMRLTDLENSAESGIDVVASPPGKKLQNVLLLSGGEKALTALALLVGIFQYQPSPFCILDEVDAPLDEANIGRFTELVREMSVQTQFVLITHSKKTMSIAPVLYGVTMQEPGVSKLVSVRFSATA
jgi:chromosome segregation protein